MKTQIKRFSKSTLAVVLTLCMLVSCMTVGIIATDAAYDNSPKVGAVDDSESVGSDSKIIFVTLTASWADSSKILVHYWGGASSGDASLSSYSGTVYKASIPDDSTGMKLHWNGGDWYGSDGDASTNNHAELYENNGAKVTYGTYQVTSTASLSATKTSMTTSETSTLTPSLATNTDYNEIKSTSYSVTTNPGSAGSVTSAGVFSATAAGTYTVTATVTYNAKGFTGITKTATATKQITVTQAATNYTGITAVAKGTTDGTNYGVDLGTIQSSTTVSSSTGLAVNAGTQSGYTFYKWVASGSGTFDSATSASTKFHPAASSEVATAQYKKNYTFSNGTTDTHGTVTVPSGTVLAGASYSGKVTPADGYKIKSLTVGGNTVTAAAGKTSAYTYSGTTGSSTTGTTTPISVVASFEPITNLQLYIAGRFRVRPSAGSTNWTTTYASNSDWNATSTNIPFTYVSGTTYKVDTYASLKELSAQPTNNQDPWFFVYDKTNSKGWHATSQNRELGTTTEYNLTTNTDTYNVRFNSSSNDSPVTIYFDYNTKRLWYSIPDLYDVTCSTATGGSVTASPSRCEEGTAVTLTIAPSNGYELSSITAKRTGTSTAVTLSGTGNTRTFTMPAAGVTVTPVFEKISYAVSVDAKYSNDGTNFNQTFPSGSKPAVTIAANTATQLDGVAVTAPATDPTGYKFAGWYTTTGRFANAANKDTTFYPNAANAVAIAKYKKIFKITSSVDDTGTGAGTVSTGVSEVVAGGSYTITATAASGSAIESVKVNGTAKTATASQTISSVSANQTVVVKFKSNVYLKGTMNSTAWAGDVMQANAAGTTYTISDVVLNAGTTYEFKHWVDSGGAGTYSTTVGTWTLNNIATHSTKSDGYGGTNLTITPSVKAKVTFVSDGTKFTSITAVPYDSTKYTVTLKKVAGSTITGSYMGTDFTTASADATVQVYSGTAINFTVTADSDKYLTGITTSSGTLDPVFNATTHAATYTGAVTVTAATTITPAVAGKLKVTSTTNNTSWGTVSATPEYARPGETVTLTYTAAAGTLKTLTVVNTSTSTKVKEWTRDANGDMKVTYPSQSSANQFTQVGLSGIVGSIYSFIKDAGEALGAADDSTAVGDDPLTFTMPNGAVTVTSTYEEYVGTSEYIYHGVNTSGQAVSGYESKAMSEGVIGGQKYAYYNVTGRENEAYNQLFYISKGGSYDGRYVYFTSKASYTDWQIGSGADDHVTAYFFNSSGAVGDAWPGKAMTWVSGSGSNVDKDWKLEIPAGATGVIFTNGKSGGDFKQTHDINLTNTNGSYYPSGYSSNKYEVTQWTTPGENSGIIAGTDYYWDTYVYKNQWYTGGFNNHKVNNDHNYAKPKDGNGQTFSDSKSDYYIVVLYPNTSYTFNLPGHDAETKTVGYKPMVLWMPQLPGQTETVSSYVKVYAKDGTIRRDGDKPERNNRTYSTFEHHANTFVYSDSGYANHIGTRSSNDGQSSEGTGYDGYTYDYIQKFEKGETLYIKTDLKSDTYMDRYYLYAYSINGKCYQIHTVAESQTGSVTEAFTVPEDWEYEYVEITPIYFLRDSSNAITFYVEGYDDEVMHAGWGNTPFVYPFYQDANFNYVTNVNNPFGGYPGQPLVFYKGNYYTQLPRTFDAIPESGGTATSCTIKGVTLGNGYWDDIHVLTKEVKSHFQTYDYDDLYKIYKEYPDQADHIICSFKYRTQYNNNEPATCTSANTSTYKNGWELLTDYYGRPVDVFGNLLTGDALTAANSILNAQDPAEAAKNATGVVHAISQDYKSNSAGDYGTEWAIYNTDGNKVTATSGGKTTIVPSALALTETGHFQNYDSATRAFQSIYDALKADNKVVGQPVVITYEKSIYGGGDKADRCDARWYYSKAGQTINATTRIEYTDDGKNWVTDTYNENTGTGSHTGTQAYFTGKSSTAKDKPDSGSSTISGKNTTTISGTTGGGYYTFNAENHNGTNGNYEFVGWYLLRDNYQNINLRSDYGAVSEFPSHAEMAKNGDIFVARFKKTATGTLDIFHEVHPQTSGYGHVYVEAIVKDAGGTQQGSKIGSISGGTLTDHIQIPSDYIRSGEGYTVEATFKAVAYPTSHFDDFYATIGELLKTYDGYGFIKTKNIDKSNGTATITYDVDKLFSVASGSPVQTVTSITHYSKFSLRDDLTYNLEYRFTTRYYGDKLYKYTNQAFTAEELRSYFRSQIENDQVDSITIDAQFVQRKAPFESNYREDLTWVIDNVQIVNNVGSLTATQVPIQWANAIVYDFQDNGSMKTNQMAAPLDKLFDKDVHTKPDNADSARQNWDTTCTDDKLYTALRTSYTDPTTHETVPLYLHHWEAYRLDSFTYKTDSDGNPQMKVNEPYNLDIDMGKSTLVCMSYSTKFNYIGYEDYAIVPVYTTNQMSTPERQAASDSRTDSSATLLTITRNHWNTNVAGNTQGGKYENEGDRLYVDFMLNYNYSKNGTNVLLSSTGDNIKVGFIVRSYTIDYSSGTGVKDYTGRSSKVYVLTNEEKRTIDNKNRIEYCYGFANSQNNSQYGLNFEFIPFIVDTASQGSSKGDTVKINGTDYKTLYDSSTVSILDGVNFYMIGKSDTTWDK